MTAPTYVERDTHEGRWSATRDPKTKGQGWTLGWEYAEVLAAQIGESGHLIMWIYKGHTRTGRMLFSRQRVYAYDGCLHVYGSDGHRVLIYPEGRKVRYLGRPA